jgi:hypothetical protein
MGVFGLETSDAGARNAPLQVHPTEAFMGARIPIRRWTVVEGKEPAWIQGGAIFLMGSI